LNSKNFYDLQSKQSKEEEKQKKYKQDCNPPETIVQLDEAGIIEGWKLQGVLLLIRHGDRGPMVHVRGISNVNCGIDGNPLINKYRSFLLNSSSATVGPGHATWQKTGNFHGFPLLPATLSKCFLGQLTYQ
jgi:2-phosphoxylose phosphatase